MKLLSTCQHVRTLELRSSLTWFFSAGVTENSSRWGVVGVGGYIPKCGQTHTWMRLVFKPSAAPRWPATLDHQRACLLSEIPHKTEMTANFHRAETAQSSGFALFDWQLPSVPSALFGTLTLVVKNSLVVVRRLKDTSGVGQIYMQQVHIWNKNKTRKHSPKNRLDDFKKRTLWKDVCLIHCFRVLTIIFRLWIVSLSTFIQQPK